jgi:MFS family permease
MRRPIARMVAAEACVFFGWKVVAVAFVVTTFTWGIGLYGLSIFVGEIERIRGWSVTLVSAAVTCNMLVGAPVFAKLPALYARFGIARVTQAGAVLTALGLVGWAVAAEPWQLFAITPLTAAGWAMTSGAAANAIVSPWFDQRRPAALSMAMNGSSVGGILFSPLVVFLIASFGLRAAAVVVGSVTAITVVFLSARYLAPTPADLGLKVDNGVVLQTAANAHQPLLQPIARDGAWRDRRLSTQMIASALAMFAQIGLLMQLYSLLVPAMGTREAGIVMSLMTVFTLLGRGALALVMRPSLDRRVASIMNTGVMILGSAALLLSGGDNVALLVAGSLLFGLGSGNVASLPPLIAQAEFTPSDVPRAIGLVFGFSQACFAFAPLTFGALRGLASDGSLMQASIVFLATGVLQVASVVALLAGMPARSVSGAEIPLS